jgi:hypothetical protein
MPSDLRRYRRTRDTGDRWGRICTRKPSPAHAAFRRWLEDAGVSPHQAPTIVATADVAERWLSEHRLPIMAAGDRDLAAWAASPLGAALGDAGLEALWLLKRWARE